MVILWPLLIVSGEVRKWPCLPHDRHEHLLSRFLIILKISSFDPGSP